MLLFTPLLSENLYAEKTHQGTSKNVRCVRLNSVKKSTLIKAFHRTSFPTKEITTYFEKTVTQNKPVFARRKTTRGFARKNCTLTKPHYGASFRRLGCSAFCAEIHTEHCALRRSHICAKLPHRGGSIRTLRYGKRAQAIHSPVLSHYII